MNELIKDLNKNERISFPVDFDLKVIMDATIPEDTNAANIADLLQRLEIRNTFRKKMLSEKGRYMSFTFHVTIETYEMLKALYNELRTLPGIKFAV